MYVRLYIQVQYQLHIHSKTIISMFTCIHQPLLTNLCRYGVYGLFAVHIIFGNTFFTF